MTKSNEFHLEGTDDMLKELNNTQGRYVPVWMQNPENKKTKTKEDKHAIRKRDIRVDQGKTTQEEKTTDVSKGQAKNKTKKTNEQKG